MSSLLRFNDSDAYATVQDHICRQGSARSICSARYHVCQYLLVLYPLLLIPIRISKANHLSANQFNWLGTIFFLSYLLFMYPQSLALQRWPVGKWMRFVKTKSSNSLRLIAIQASMFSFGPLLCCVMPPARVSVACSPPGLFLEFVREPSLQGL